MLPHQREWEDSCERVRVNSWHTPTIVPFHFTPGCLTQMFLRLSSDFFFSFLFFTALLERLHLERRRRGSSRLWRTLAFLVGRSDSTQCVVSCGQRGHVRVHKQRVCLSSTERWDWTVRFHLWHFLRANTEDLPSHRHRGTLQEDVSLFLFLTCLPFSMF